MKNEEIELLVAIFEHADNKNEECAVVFENNGKHRAVSVPNRHPNPGNEFRIRKSDTASAKKDGETLVAVMHTHTAPGNQEPSYEDVKQQPDGLLGIVYHPRSKSWTLYDNKVGVLAFYDGSKK